MAEDLALLDVPLHRFDEQIDQKTSVREKDFPVNVTEKKDYGHGDIQVLQVLPESLAQLSPDELKKTRLLIYCQPWNVTGSHELEKLQDDLQALAKSRQGSEPVRVVGIAYTGIRSSNSSKVVDAEEMGLPDGVKVTQMQVDKANDVVAALKDLDLIDGKNAEIIGFSAGGPIAQLAETFGLLADTVGLFNASSLDNKGYGQTAARVVLEGLANSLVRHPREYLDLEQLANNKAQGHESRYRFTRKETRPLKDRISRSLSENIAVGRSRTHQLVGNSPETKYIIGQTKRDLVYPQRRIRNLLSNRNVSYVSLEGWTGHHMGATPASRRERLGEIGKAMLNARQE